MRHLQTAAALAVILLAYGLAGGIDHATEVAIAAEQANPAPQLTAQVRP